MLMHAPLVVLSALVFDIVDIDAELRTACTSELGVATQTLQNLIFRFFFVERTVIVWRALCSTR